MEDFNNKLKFEGAIYNELKHVIDPEVGLNIIDMGLVYEIEVSDSKSIDIKMTLSSKGCPLGDVIIKEVKAILTNAFPEYNINVTLVWEPMWSPEMLTEDGKKELGRI